MLLLSLSSVMGCQLRDSHSTHLSLGNPTHAQPRASRTDNYLQIKPQYALAYSQKLGRARWVSWQLNQTWLGEVDRQNDFRPDPGLPPDWPPIFPSDYRRTGYDRGHWVPSSDRTRTVEDNSSTFLMTNIMPQAPDNNQGPWVELEKDCRTWVQSGQSLYILAGGYGERPAVAGGKLVPPARLWKVIVRVNSLDGKQPVTPRQIDSQTTLIAVDMPNAQGIRDRPWQDYQVTVDQIEAATGLNLLSRIPTKLQKNLERQRFPILKPKSAPEPIIP